MVKSGILLFFGLFLPLFGSAQILDDSTKQVYGPSSVGFLYENNFLQDDTLLLHPDTLLGEFRFATLNKANGWLWQDLGNEGTAAKPFLFQTPSNSFTEVGLTAFSSFYAPKTENIKYYNTHSPYTKMAYTQSSNGMFNLGFIHSQNINPRLNVTLDLHRIVSSKQYSANTSEDRLLDHWDYTISSNYTSKSRKYSLLAALIHFNHKQKEQGGISDAELPEDLSGKYNTRYEQRFSGIESRERWNNPHVYQQYQLSKGIQLFNVFDFQKQNYLHSDTLIDDNQAYGIYDEPYSDTTLSKMKTHYSFQNIQNRAGFKGFFKGFKYSIGLTSRFYAYKALHESNDKNSGTEFLIGGNAGYWLADSLSYLNTDFYIGAGDKSENIYLNSRLKYKGAVLGFKFISKPAHLFYRTFITPVVNWENSFNNVLYTQASANYALRSEKAWLESDIHLNLVNNHLYFDHDQKPQQLTEDAFLYDVGIKAGVQLKNWKFENRFIYTGTNKEDIFRMPTVMNNTNIEFHIFYAKVLDLYLGTDIYYRSKYKGDNYSPLLRSFYLQDEKEVWGQPVADVYANFMIKGVKLAFNLNFANQGVPHSGFYTTPNYLAMGRTFFIKVDWPLFD